VRVAPIGVGLIRRHVTTRALSAAVDNLKNGVSERAYVWNVWIGPVVAAIASTIAVGYMVSGR